MITLNQYTINLTIQIQAETYKEIQLEEKLKQTFTNPKIKIQDIRIQDIIKE